MLKKQLKRDFIQKYFAKLSTTNSYAEAYEMAEKDHIRDFGGEDLKIIIASKSRCTTIWSRTENKVNLKVNFLYTADCRAL